MRFLNALRSKGLESINAFAAEEINQYHRRMVQCQTYSFSLVNQSINAVKFYFQRVLGRYGLDLTQVERPEKADRLPTVLSKQEVARILSATGNLKHRCLLQRGTNLRYIQTLLGHRSSKTTDIYTHITSHGLEGIISPLDNL